MNKLWVKYALISIGLTFILLSCSVNNPPDYRVGLKEFEKKWENCYKDRFIFPNDSRISSTEYLICDIDGKEISIIDDSSGYEGRVFYSYSGYSSDPEIQLGNNDSTTNKLYISFINFNSFKAISLVLKYPTDSLNYYVQKVFSNHNLVCATNFQDMSIEFVISTNCEINGSIIFSSYYSSKEKQLIRIDNFNYKMTNGMWVYHLEYSFDNLEITNVNWNEMNMTDIFGNKLSSNVLIENLDVKNLKCIIEFELPPG